MLQDMNQPHAGFAQLIHAGHQPVIMQVVPSLNGGGVEQGVVDLNAAIVAAGGRSIVVSSGGIRVPEIVRAGGEHIDMPVHSKNPIIMARNVKTLRRLIEREHVQVVHACSRAPAWSASRAVKGTHAKFVTSCHAAHNVGGNVKRYYNSAIAKGESVIAVSHFLSQYLQDNYHTDPDRITVVHRGVSMGRFHPNCVTPERLINIAKEWRVPDGAFIMVLPGRITRGKGHMCVVAALAKLGRTDIFCVFLGKEKKKSTYKEELVAHIEAHGLGSQIRMVEHCADMPAAYMLANIVLSPSIEPEGFGRIPIEAQAMGRPVIATSHGGAMETIVPDETGWLVTPNDADELRDAIDEALGLDNQQRAILATRAMVHVAENFSLETMCAQTLDVYAALLGVTPPKKEEKPDTANVTEQAEMTSADMMDVAI